MFITSFLLYFCLLNLMCYAHKDMIIMSYHISSPYLCPVYLKLCEFDKVVHKLHEFEL